jgi:hypothetical protein
VVKIYRGKVFKHVHIGRLPALPSNLAPRGISLLSNLTPKDDIARTNPELFFNRKGAKSAEKDMQPSKALSKASFFIRLCVLCVFAFKKASDGHSGPLMARTKYYLGQE